MIHACSDAAGNLCVASEPTLDVVERYHPTPVIPRARLLPSHAQVSAAEWQIICLVAGILITMARRALHAVTPLIRSESMSAALGCPVLLKMDALSVNFHNIDRMNPAQILIAAAWPHCIM